MKVSKIAKGFKMLPKWRVFAKSGHTGCERREGRKRKRSFQQPTSARLRMANNNNNKDKRRQETRFGGMKRATQRGKINNALRDLTEATAIAIILGPWLC